MTKQNHIHKLLVVRQKGSKEILKTLSHTARLNFNRKRKRRRTRNEATYKRLRKEHNNE